MRYMRIEHCKVLCRDIRKVVIRMQIYVNSEKISLGFDERFTMSLIGELSRASDLSVLGKSRLYSRNLRVESGRTLYSQAMAK